MIVDAKKNLAYSLVATAPSTPTAGTSLVVTAAQGARFPTAPFNATICPAGAVPTPANSEIVRVTAVSTDTLTIVRAQESTVARTVVVGDQIYAGVTVKALTDLETILTHMVFDVKNYGAVGDDSTDDTVNIQTCIAAAGASGGKVFAPNGTYKLTTNPLKLYTGTTPYSDITITGAGSNKTIFKQYTTGIDVFQALNGTTPTQLLNVNLEDFSMAFGGTATNSGNGIYFKNVNGGPSFQQIRLKNLIATGLKGTGKYGFNVESMITSSFDTVMAVDCANGFYLNGAVGGAYGTVSTSVTFLNTYANGCVTNGYNILDCTYISFVGSAVDFATGSGIGYLIDGCASVSFTGSGAELSGTFTGQLWKITASNNVGLYNCYAFQNDNVAVLVTGASTKVTIIGFQNNSDTNTTTIGLQVDAGSQVTEIDNDWGAATTQRSINATGIDLRPAEYRISSITSSATPTANAGTDDLFDITAAAANMTVAAPTGTPVNGQKIIYRFKDNATARTIAWNAVFVAGGVALPTTTVISKILNVGFQYNTANGLNKWQCIASSQEA